MILRSRYESLTVTKRDPKWAKHVRLVPENPGKLPPEIRNVEFSIEYIDAQTGAAYAKLEADRNVRHLKPEMVTRYRGDMAGGMFVFNGDPICLVPSNGKQNRKPGKQRIANGNHRAHAAAGLTDPDAGYYSLVLKNVAVDAEETWDRNMKRSLGQILRARGEVNPFTMASMTRWACAYERYGVRWDLSKSTPSDGEQEQYFDNNVDDLRWANELTNTHRQVSDMHPSPFGFYIYITGVLTNRELANQFWIDHFANADMIPKDHPGQQLSNKLKAMRRANDGKKCDYNTQTCLAFAAWNAWCNGDDPVTGPWERLKTPTRWNSANMPELLPRSYRKEIPLIHDSEDEHD